VYSDTVHLLQQSYDLKEQYTAPGEKKKKKERERERKKMKLSYSKKLMQYQILRKYSAALSELVIVQNHQQIKITLNMKLKLL
jgi:hypothetical protein